MLHSALSTIAVIIAAAPGVLAQNNLNVGVTPSISALNSYETLTFTVSNGCPFPEQAISFTLKLPEEVVGTKIIQTSMAADGFPAATTSRDISPALTLGSDTFDKTIDSITWTGNLAVGAARSFSIYVRFRPESVDRVFFPTSLTCTASKKTFNWTEAPSTAGPGNMVFMRMISASSEPGAIIGEPHGEGSGGASFQRFLVLAILALCCSLIAVCMSIYVLVRALNSPPVVYKHDLRFSNRLDY